jgi:hypothetical protein
MRRRPFSFGMILALAVLWLAADVRIGGTVGDAAGGTVASSYGETMAISSSHVALGTVSGPRKAPPGDWTSRPFLSARSLTIGVVSATAPAASHNSRIRERAPHTFTYDATAPPGETANTVL